MINLTKLRKWLVLLIPITLTLIFLIISCNDEKCEVCENTKTIPMGTTQNFVTTSSYITNLPPFDLEILTTCVTTNTSGEEVVSDCIIYKNKVSYDNDKKLEDSYIDLSPIQIKNNRGSKWESNESKRGPYSPPQGQDGPQVQVWLMPTSTFDLSAIRNGTGVDLGTFNFFGTAEAKPAIGPLIKVSPNYLRNSPAGGWHIFAKITNNTGDENFSNDSAYLKTITVTNSGDDYYGLVTNSKENTDTLMILLRDTILSDAELLAIANRPIKSPEDFGNYMKDTKLIEHIVSYYQSYNSTYYYVTAQGSSNVLEGDYTREKALSSDLYATEDRLKSFNWGTNSASLIGKLKRGGTYYLRVQKSPWEKEIPTAYNYSLKWFKLTNFVTVYELKPVIPDIVTVPMPGLSATLSNTTLNSTGSTAYDLVTNANAANKYQLNTNLGSTGGDVHWYKIVVPSS